MKKQHVDRWRQAGAWNHFVKNTLLTSLYMKFIGIYTRNKWVIGKKGLSKATIFLPQHWSFLLLIPCLFYPHGKLMAQRTTIVVVCLEGVLSFDTRLRDCQSFKKGNRISHRRRKWCFWFHQTQWKRKQNFKSWFDLCFFFLPFGTEMNIRFLFEIKTKTQKIVFFFSDIMILNLCFLFFCFFFFLCVCVLSFVFCYFHFRRFAHVRSIDFRWLAVMTSFRKKKTRQELQCVCRKK